MRRSVRAAALVVVAGLVVACSGDDADLPPLSSAEDAPARSTTTTAPPAPTLERVAVDPTVLGGEGDQRLHAVATGIDRLVAGGTAGDRAAIWLSLDGVAWSRVELDPAEVGDGSRIDDIVAVDRAFVAVGQEAGRAAAWTSVDGRAWRRAQVAPGVAMTLVADSPVGLLAFGDDAEASDGAAAWYSVDGEYWDRAPTGGDEVDRPGTARVAGVGEANGGVVALVDRREQGAEVWTSRDAASWRVGPMVGRDLLPAEGRPHPGALATLGSTLVAVGSVAKPDGVDAGVWTATRAGSWEAVPHDEAAFGGDGAQVMTAVVALGGGLLAAGTETLDAGGVDAVVWTSSDGGAWRRAQEPAGVARAGDQHVADAALAGERVVAVGWETTDAGTDAVIWTLGTVDAPPPPDVEGPVLAWERVAHHEPLGGSGEQRMAAVAGADDGFVAVGAATEEDGDGLDAAVWTSADGAGWERVDDRRGVLGGPGDQELLAVVAAGPSLVAAGRDGGSAAVWVASGGGPWERVAHDEGVFGGPGDQVAAGVATGPAGLLVVGWDGGTGDGDAAVWESPDGVAWARVPGDEGLGGPGRQAMRAVAVSPAGLAAVGADGDGAAGWWSPDGRRWAREALGPGTAASVAAQGEVVVAAGSVPGEGGSDATAWTLVAGGWERAEGGDLAGAHRLEGAGVVLADVVTILVGSADDGRGVDAAAWASADAASWTRTPHDENVFGGDQAQHMAGVTVRDGTAVAVGWSGSTPAARDAAVWITSRVDSGGAGSAL